MSEGNLIKIEANARTGTGKSYCRKLRNAGKIPGVIIGKAETKMIELDPKWLPRAYKESRQFDLVLDGETKRVKIQEVAIDPVKRFPLHVDLMYV